MEGRGADGLVISSIVQLGSLTQSHDSSIAHLVVSSGSEQSDVISCPEKLRKTKSQKPFQTEHAPRAQYHRLTSAPPIQNAAIKARSNIPNYIWLLITDSKFLEHEVSSKLKFFLPPDLCPAQGRLWFLCDEWAEWLWSADELLAFKSLLWWTEASPRDTP